MIIIKKVTSFIQLRYPSVGFRTVTRKYNFEKEHEEKKNANLIKIMIH